MINNKTSKEEIEIHDKLTILSKALLDKYGVRQQLLKMVEELNEYNAALLHCAILHCFTSNEIKLGILNDKLIDEIADLVIVFHQYDTIISQFADNDSNFTKEYEDKLIKRIKFKIDRLDSLLIAS